MFTIQKQPLLLLITESGSIEEYCLNSKTTFVTVNPLKTQSQQAQDSYSKTTFVTVNLGSAS